MKTIEFKKKRFIDYIPLGLNENMVALLQIMAWCQTGNKPLFEAMLVGFSEASMHHLASMT